MNFTYENQGTNTFLVYAVSEDDVLDSMTLGMLTNNKIQGLAQTLYMQMDTQKFVKFNVSAKIAVSQFFSGIVNKKRLIGVFKGIVDAMLSAEDYMIDTASIVLDPNYIFSDVSTCETVLVCLPLMDTDKAVDLSTFFKNIMFTTQFDQTENCDYVAKIINYLNSAPVFSLVDFNRVLSEIQGTASAAQAPQTAAPQPSVQAHTAAPSAQPSPVVPQPAQNTTPPAPQSAVPTSPAAPAVKSVVPPTVQKKVETAPAQDAAATPEKKISMVDLLLHYSKENAAAYKAQKEATKKTAAPKQPTPPTMKGGIAIPGQPTPPPAKGNIAIPGQPTPPVSAKVTAPAVPSKSPSVQPKVPGAPAVMTPPVTTPPVQTNPVYTPPVTPAVQSANFGETTVLGGGNIGETTVLGAMPTATQPKPHLIRMKNNEKITLEKEIFRIGKEKSFVDYFIGDNPAISRSHANILVRNGAYFVVDTNSTNHTYVNGTMCPSNAEVALSHGDKVRFANEEFTFNMY